MNKPQKTVLLIGMLLALTAGVFVPYDAEIRGKGDNLKKYIGYHLLFSPPDRLKVMRGFDVVSLKKARAYEYAQNYEDRFRKDALTFHVLHEIVWIELGVITLLTIGAMGLFQAKKE